MSLSELGRARGLAASAQVLASETRPATIDEADAFGIAPGAELLELHRLRMLDGLPFSLDTNRVPLRCLPPVAGLDFRTASLYEAMDRAGTPPVRAEYELEARLAGAGEAELLDLAPGAPVLHATTVAIGEDGRAVDLGRTVYRADRYRFQATLMRRAHREREGDHEDSLARGRAGRAGDGARRVWRDAGPGGAGGAQSRHAG
jgi:GntR family transcriptional regulator